MSLSTIVSFILLNEDDMMMIIVLEVHSRINICRHEKPGEEIA